MSAPQTLERALRNADKTAAILALADVFAGLGVDDHMKQCRMAGRLCREFGPTTDIALESALHEDPAVLKQEAERILRTESAT